MLKMFIDSIYMKNYLVLFFAIINLSAVTSDFENDIVVKKVVSPERLIAPERGYMTSEFFACIFVRPDFAKPMASAYGDIVTMKYLGDGSTLSLKEVENRFSRRAKIINSEQNPSVYSWGVITRDGVCGVISAFFVESGVYEVSRLLLPFMQGCKQGRALLEVMFNYLPDVAWKATAHPDNIKSWKSQESAGFVFEKKAFVEEYKGPRIFQSRPSNYTLEGRETFFLPYSNRYVSLASLMAQ
jgi:RimJ/RimL family protein N-acetyltransferase